MKVVYSKCEGPMGEKEGPEDEITHSLCEECAEVIRAEVAAFKEAEGNGNKEAD